MNDELQKRLGLAFPAETDAMVMRGVKEGVLLADGLLESEPLLKTLVGRDLRGHLRRAGVFFRIHDLCTSGDLPFDGKIEKMLCGNWHWLELKSKDFKAHVCRTEGIGAFPEDTQSRQDARLKSQTDLFESNVVPFKQLADDVGGLYAWLTYNISHEGVLNHLCWAMPAREGDVWLAHIDVVRRAALAVATVASQPPAKKLGLKFKDHIEDALTKKTDNDNGSTK